MPRIPTYDGPLVAPQSAPDVRLGTRGAAEAAAGAGRGEMLLGKGFSDAGGGIVDIAVQLQHQSNLEKVQAAQAAYGEQTLGWLNEAKSNRVGHKAEGVTKDFSAWHAKAASDIEAGLDNDAQKKAFRSLAQRAALASKSEIAGFELGEKKKAAVAAYNAANTNAVNVASTAASPQLFAMQRENILNSVAAFAATQGFDVEQTKAEQEKWTSALHLQRMQNLVGRNAEEARRYFEENKHEISGSLHEQADKLLKTGELKDGSLKLQFELSKLPGLSAQTKELDQRFKDGKITAEMRDATLTRLEHANAQRKAQQAEWEGNLLGATQDFKLKNPGATIMDLPPQLYNGLKNSGKLVQAVSIFERGDKSDPTTVLDLHEMARRDPEGFRSLNLRTYIGRVSTSDLEQFAKMQKDPKELRDAGTLSEQLSDMHDQMRWGTGDKEKKGTFDKAVRDEIDLEQKRLGKVLTYEERAKIIERMAIKGSLEGKWFSGRQYFQVQGTPEAEKFKPEISKTDQATIDDRFFKRNKRPPTEKERLEIYRKWKGL